MDYYEIIHCILFLDEEDDLSDDEVSANPVEGWFFLLNII